MWLYVTSLGSLFPRHLEEEAQGPQGLSESRAHIYLQYSKDNVRHYLLVGMYILVLIISSLSVDVIRDVPNIQLCSIRFSRNKQIYE